MQQKVYGYHGDGARACMFRLDMFYTLSVLNQKCYALWFLKK